MMFLCLVGGMCSEMVGAAIIVHCLFLGYGIYKSIKGEVKLPLWYYGGVLGFLIEYILLYFSPNHHKRAAIFVDFGEYHSLKEILQMSFSQQISRLNGIYRGFAVPFIARVPLSIVVLMCFKMRKIALDIAMFISVSAIKNSHHIGLQSFFALLYLAR